MAEDVKTERENLKEKKSTDYGDFPDFFRDRNAKGVLAKSLCNRRNLWSVFFEFSHGLFRPHGVGGYWDATYNATAS